MGWDAGFNTEAKDKRKQFKKTATEVKRIAGLVDGSLQFGGLDCSTCRLMLEQATAQNCSEGTEWSAEQVQQIASAAVWEFVFQAEDAWAYWSARKFLETCAAIGGVIYFY